MSSKSGFKEVIDRVQDGGKQIVPVGHRGTVVIATINNLTS